MNQPSHGRAPRSALTRRAFARGFALAATSLGLPALRAQGKAEKSKVVIAVGGKSSFYYLPLTIADQLGYFKTEGLDVEVSDFPTGARALQAVVGGSADICSGAFENTISLQSRNQMFQAFVLQGRTPQIAFGVSTRNMPDFKTMADLKGKRIGVSAPGSSTNTMVNLMLTKAGLKPSDVSFVEVGTAAAAVAAIRSGQIDAMSNTDPVMTLLEQKSEVKIISDTRTLKGTVELFGGPMPAACLFASNEFVQKNSNTCQALSHAIVHALKWLQTAGPGDIIKTVPENYLFGDRALYLAAFNKVRDAISPDGLIPEEAPRTALKALSSFDATVRADRIDLSKTYTNEFARRSKVRFKA
ncbi:MAG: ABC transporter substrate-binding protein [Pseudomonadota bacterium]